MALRHLSALAAALAAACGSSVAGSFQTIGPSSWRLAPDTCASGLHRGYLGVDLYRLDPDDDTELVIESGGVLARLPGRGLMVRLGTADCRVLDVDLHPNGVKVNGVPALAGSVTLDCERSELGRLTGQARFSCY
jgi:hypothetical protein